MAWQLVDFDWSEQVADTRYLREIPTLNKAIRWTRGAEPVKKQYDLDLLEKLRPLRHGGDEVLLYLFLIDITVVRHGHPSHFPGLPGTSAFSSIGNNWTIKSSSHSSNITQRQCLAAIHAEIFQMRRIVQEEVEAQVARLQAGQVQWLEDLTEVL